MEKLIAEIRKHSEDLNKDYVNPQTVIDKIQQSLPEYKVSDEELYALAAETAAQRSTIHPDYGLLAGRLAVQYLHDNTTDSFVDSMKVLYEYRNEHTGEHHPLLDPSFYRFVEENAHEIQKHLDYSRDFTYELFGYRTLEKSYLLKANKKIVERPQHMLMRVALAINIGDLQEGLKVYKQLSEKQYTHATPTLFNAGTRRQQMSSCFLLTVKEDSISGIYETLKQCALISQNAGGIGLAIHDVRAKGSFVKGTNGYSNGIIPMLRVYNDTARYVDQGSGKRKGAFAIYLEPWHSEISDFLSLKKNHGKEEMRARDLFYALWINDLFMKRVEANEDWTLFDPNRVPGLADSWGKEFEDLYLKYESEGRGKKIKARDLWFEIITSQVETGSPFMLYKDAANAKSNQQNLGTIRSSNLCVTFDSKILTENGYVDFSTIHNGKTIKDPAQLAITAVTVNGKLPVTEVVRTSELEEVFEVTLDNGMTLKSTAYHKYKTSGGLRELRELRVGDKVKIFDGSVPSFGKNNDPEAGLYFGLSIGTALKSDHEKKVPDRIWSSDRETVSAFLRGVFSAETWVAGGDSDAEVRLAGTKALLGDVQLMLLQFGINSRVAPVGTSYALEVTNRSNIAKFQESVGFLDFSKNESVARYLEDTKDLGEQETYEVGIQSIALLGKEPVYCVKESKFNEVCLNGMHTSNCTEIIQYTSADEVAVCNLASIALNKFVRSGQYDHEALYVVAKQVIRNLNKVIDLNYYPVPEARTSNHKHRPVGLGVQGLADTFILMGLPFESPEARLLNKEIFETLYFASLESSCELAEKYGTYESYPGSPVSKGVLQFDMWGVTPSDRWDWEELRSRIAKHGVRNSLLLAPMPTASTSQILGNNECIEPITSNIYSRRVLAGEFAVVNKYLVNDLIKLGLWNNEMKDKIVANNGSVQGISEIPANLREVYKTVWEIKQRTILEMAADRGAYICQSQSLNIHMTDTNFAKMSSLHMAAWKLGLKTGMYYLRTKSASEAIKFTIKEDIPAAKSVDQSTSDMVCSLDNPESCEACGS